MNIVRVLGLADVTRQNPETEAKFGPSRLFSLLSENVCPADSELSFLGHHVSNSLFQQKTAAQMRIFLFLDGTIPDPSDLERLSFMMLPFLSCAPFTKSTTEILW